MANDSLLATFTLSSRENGQLELRVQHADGKWHAVSLERVLAPGWHELKFVWNSMRVMLEGENTLPW